MGAKRKILILGGGFGGIKAALELSDSSHFEVVLISDRNHFRYYPTLYHAATGGNLTASKISLSEIFKGTSVKVIIDEIGSIDRSAMKVRGKSASYHFDNLIVALGVVTNYFGIKGLEKYAYGIKSVEEAVRLRDHLHKLLLDEGKPDLNYVVVGGGPTGVELAGALPGYLRHIMDSHGIAKRSLNIELVEAAPRLMPRMSRRYSRAAEKRLRNLGVKLHLNQAVQAETADQLMVSGHAINSRTVIWTAGVTNHPFFRTNDFALGQNGKVIVDKFLQAEPGIFIIGDNADTPYSGMAQTALHDAEFVAHNLKSIARGHDMDEYRPKRPVYITPVGPHWAAVSWGRLEFFGRLGWLLRTVADLIGYKDFEAWWPAGKHLMAELSEQDDCPACAK